MAAKLSTKQGRTTPASSNIYTLPLSCQICLGKVRQPVLCSNFHVFCHTCIDTWLERSNRCPSCRVLIDHTNPVKQIRGGLGQIDEDDRERSTPELRKTRFDLLYRDYEDTLESLELEVKRLRCENARLKSQLSTDHGAGSSGTGGGGGGGGSGSAKATGSKEQQLQLLTGKLQDAQKLYDRVKQDISKLKKENHSLKEANANLTHENTRLREEISSRSPHKFGRLTVATLEAQLESQRKEVQRLTRALERSDQYIESLQHQLDQAAPPGHHDQAGSHSVGNGHKTHPQSSAPSSSSVRASDSGSGLSVKRQLFSSQSQQGSDLNPAEGKGSARSADSEKKFGEYSSSSALGKTFDSKSGDALESIMRKSDIPSKTDPKKEKSPVKKVHFSVSEKKSNDSSSFNLEVPSPIVPSASIDGSLSLDKLPTRLHEAVSKPAQKSDYPLASSDWVEPSQKGNDLSSRRVSSYSASVREDPFNNVFRQRYDDRGGGKEAGEPGSNSNLSEPEFSTPQSLNELDSDKFHPSRKSAPLSREAVDRRKSKKNQDANFSFNLDEPSLDDTQTIQTELKDLDISMTPELSDCLKLLNRAERKVSHADFPYLSTQAGTTSAGNIGCVTAYSTSLQPSSQEKHFSIPVHDKVPNLPSQTDRMMLGKSTVHLGLEHTSGHPGSSGFSGSSGVPGTYVPGTTGVMSSWEHGFFSSLRVNPFKHAAPHTFVPTTNLKQNGIPDVIAQPDEFRPFSGQTRAEQPFSLPVGSQNTALTDTRRSEYPPMSAALSSYRIPVASGYGNIKRSLSLDQLPGPPSTLSGNPSTVVGFPHTQLSEQPGVSTNFLSDRPRSSEPGTSLTSSVYPLNIASSSGLSRQASHTRDIHNFLEQPKGVTLSSLTASEVGGGEYVSTRDRKTPNNYSYVSNASSQGIDNTDSNHLDSFLPEPKKRLFDFDSEEEIDFGTPSKTTKIL